MAASKLSQQRACTVYSTDPCCMLRGQAIDFIFMVRFCKVRTQRSERNYPGQNLSTFLLRSPFTPFTPFFNDESLWKMCFCLTWFRFLLVSPFIIEWGGEGGVNVGTKFRPVLKVLTHFWPSAVHAKKPGINYSTKVLTSWRWCPVLCS